MDIQFLQQIKEFIQFKFFIAEDVLTVFYVICAILIPFASWYFLLWVIRRYAVVIQFYKDSSYSIIFSFIMKLSDALIIVDNNRELEAIENSYPNLKNSKIVLLSDNFSEKNILIIEDNDLAAFALDNMIKEFKHKTNIESL